MAIFNSYVKLPEGKLTLPAGDFNDLNREKRAVI